MPTRVIVTIGPSCKEPTLQAEDIIDKWLQPHGLRVIEVWSEPYGLRMIEAWPEPCRLGFVDAGLSHMGDGVIYTWLESYGRWHCRWMVQTVGVGTDIGRRAVGHMHITNVASPRLG